jgi:hypothetical protein
MSHILTQLDMDNHNLTTRAGGPFKWRLAKLCFVSISDETLSPLSGDTNHFLPTSDLGQCDMKV